MKVLDLFAGLRGWSEAFEARGHETFSVDLDQRFEVDLHADITTLKALTIVELFGKPDVVLASPPCEAMTVMRIGRNWWPKEGGPNGEPPHSPKTEQARLALELVWATKRLIDDLDPTFFVVENPVGKLRRLEPVQDWERVTVTFCQYGFAYQKPTDLWGGFPLSWAARPQCAQGASCHVSAPRGSRQGVQSDRFGDFTHHDSPAQRRAKMVLDPSQTVVHVADRASVKETKSQRLAALRAKIPEQLSAELCEAMERDLEIGSTSMTLF